MARYYQYVQCPVCNAVVAFCMASMLDKETEAEHELLSRRGFRVRMRDLDTEGTISVSECLCDRATDEARLRANWGDIQPDPKESGLVTPGGVE